MAFKKNNQNYYNEQLSSEALSKSNASSTEKNNKTLISKKSISNKNDSKKEKKSKTLPKTAQDTIPYERVFKNGMIESEPGFYTKMYAFKDANFRIAPQEVQEAMYLKYMELLNSFDDTIKFQIIFNNHSTEQEELLNDVLLKPQADSLNPLRDEYNQMLYDKMAEGRNNIVNENYLVIGVKAETADMAKTSFIRIDAEVSNGLKSIVGDTTSPLTLAERLRIMHDMCNSDEEMSFKEADMTRMFQQGLSTKDIVAPAGFLFKNNYFMMGNKYTRVLFLKDYPSSLSTELTADLAALPINLTASVYYDTIQQGKAIKLIKGQMININMNVMNAQKAAIKGNYSPDLISQDLKDMQEEVSELLHDVTKRNQKLFFVTMVIMHSADSLEELDEQSKTILSLGNRYIVNFNQLLGQQEQGFAEALPLCHNQLKVERLLTTESAALFFPFSTKELRMNNGMYYGLNAVSKNLIILNRLELKNQNGIILGISGSGKSFSAKREMLNVLLSTKDDVYVIDPDGEYAAFGKAFPEISEEVVVSPGNKVYLNPFDMDLNYAKNDDGSSEDPVAMKSDFIYTLVETMMGTRSGLSANQRSILDRCVRNLYAPYLEHMRQQQLINPEMTKDLLATPTLDDFYSMLMSQAEPEARNMGLSIEMYARGSFNTFSQTTNVDTTKRFVIFNIKGLGTAMKDVGLQVCLNHVWNKIISNKGIGRRTWFYIDEFYLLTQSEASATFLQAVFKRARKWGGVMTGITQNVDDLLNTVAGRGIITNCDFIYMLSQAATDRISLAEMYKISDAQMSYITDAGPGCGLIYNGSTVVPFVDQFPQNTRMYEVMTTKFGEMDVA